MSYTVSKSSHISLCLRNTHVARPRALHSMWSSSVVGIAAWLDATSRAWRERQPPRGSISRAQQQATLDNYRTAAPHGQSSQRDAQRLTLYTISPATGSFLVVAIFQGEAACMGEVVEYSSDPDTNTYQVAQRSAFSLPYLSRIILNGYHRLSSLHVLLCAIIWTTQICLLQDWIKQF